MASTTSSPLTRLECPNCGSPINQFNPTSQAVVCGTCGSHVTLGIDPEVLSKGQKLPPSPRPIELGSKAIIAQVEYAVLGRVMYRGTDDGEAFVWNEWLLGSPDGQMLWLALDENGFVLYRKIRFRGQFNPRSDSRLDLGEKQAFIHERYHASIVGAEGELTWRAKPGERLFVAEGAGSGLKYSIQQTAEELEIHEGRPIDERSLANAFKNQAWLDKLESYKKNRRTYQVAAVACLVAALIAVFAAISVNSSGTEERPEIVELSDNSPSDTVTIDFENQRPAIVGIKLIDTRLPANSFIDIDVNMVSPDGTSQYLFAQELWHETGVDEDGTWRETQYETSQMFVPTQSGEHELDISYDGSVIDDLTIEVSIRRDHIMPMWFFIYAVVAGIAGVIFWFMASSQRPSHT